MLRRLVFAAVLLALGFALLRVGTPYVRSYQFARIIRDEVESQSVRPHPSAIHARVLELGRGQGINLADDDVAVERVEGGFQVRVHYNVPVDLIWFQYQLSFDFIQRTSSTAAPE